jgi:hypothetical protein
MVEPSLEYQITLKENAYAVKLVNSGVNYGHPMRRSYDALVDRRLIPPEQQAWLEDLRRIAWNCQQPHLSRDQPRVIALP